MIEESLTTTDDYIIELARNGKTEELRAALYQQPSKQTLEDWAGDSLLNNACWFGQKDVILMLLTDFDANINCMNKNKATPLHRATYNNNEDIVKLLLSKGANYNLKDITGKKPEDIANNSIKKLLINKRLEDESFTMKLKVKHNEQDILWDENQKILKELELENTKALRKRSAVSIVIDGAKSNKVNGIFDPDSIRFEDNWPVYIHRENPFISLKYNNDNMEWNITETISYELDNNIFEHVLVKLPCSIPNFPELRIEGSNGITEFKEFTKRDSPRLDTIFITSNILCNNNNSDIKIETLALVQGYEETLKIKEHKKKFCITDDSESDTSIEIEDWKQLSDCSDDRSIDNTNNNTNNSTINIDNNNDINEKIQSLMNLSTTNNPLNNYHNNINNNNGNNNNSNSNNGTENNNNEDFGYIK